jgi:hypothetical protein
LAKNAPIEGGNVESVQQFSTFLYLGAFRDGQHLAEALLIHSDGHAHRLPAKLRFNNNPFR